MLLRNRTRAMNKTNLMADHTTSSQQSPKQNHAPRTLPSVFCSPKFKDFTIKCLSANEALLPSPTSILDTKTMLSPPFGNNINPFSCEKNRTETSSTIISPRISFQNSSEKRSKFSSYDKIDSKGIGLGLVGALNNEDDDEQSVLFGTQLRVIKVPSTFNPFKANKDSSSSSSSQNSGICCGNKENCSGSGVLTLSEMELSEEYTCVISHGPNPRTTHIFDNCIVHSYFSSLPCSNSNYNSLHSSSSVSDFLSFCYSCKKHLQQKMDIFIYRGDRAFCSKECRHQEMVLNGEAENSDFHGY